jgi:predicted dehydrogenase
VVTQYEVASGAIVHAEGSWAMTPGFGFNMSYTVNFERATADYDIARGKEALRLCEQGQPARVIASPDPDGYVGELRHFLDAVRLGKPPTVVTAQDALGSVEICEAEEQSVRQRQIISLNP